MPQTTLVPEWDLHKPELKNYQLKSYHKIKPADHIRYTSMHTNEIFNILPELHRYQHIKQLWIHILNKKQLENMECLSRQQIQQFPNITNINLTVKVKGTDDIIKSLLKLFPNLTSIWISPETPNYISVKNNGYFSSTNNLFK